MTYRTHLAFSTAVTLIPLPLLPFWSSYNPFSYISSIIELTIILAIIFISSLAPDFDEPNSYLSKRFPWFIISRVLSLFVKHRGSTHRFIATFIYAGILSGLAYYGFGETIINYAYMLYFAAVPYLFHAIGDGFTKGGVPRFWYPFSKKTYWFLPRALRFYTGGTIENIYFLIFLGIIAIEILLFLPTFDVASFLNAS